MAVLPAYLLLLLSPSPALGDPLLPGKVRQYLQGVEARAPKPFTIAASVFDPLTGKELVGHNASQSVIPASTLKIITSIAAFKFLGSEYRFPSEIFLDRLPNQGEGTLDVSLGLQPREKPAPAAGNGVDGGNLYFRGYGDPTLLQERLIEIVQDIRRRGVSAVQNIVIDDTLFIDPPPATGPRPYQAALSAVSLNNNSYRISVAPSAVGQSAFVELTQGLPYSLGNQVKTLSGRRSSVTIIQTPVSESFNPQVKGRGVGKGMYEFPNEKVRVTVKGTIGNDAEPLDFYQSVRNPAEYLGSMLKFLLEREGIKVSGKLLKGETPRDAKLLLVYESKPLGRIVRDLNHYSSNFLAGQILFALGQDSAGYFRQDLGLQRLAKVLEDVGYRPEEFAIFDASGLDKRNRLTAEQLAKVLAVAYQDFSLAPELISSFSRFSRTGTLRERRLLAEVSGAYANSQSHREERRRADAVWAKTGTLQEVSALAGYLETRTGQRLSFTVIINGLTTKDDAVKIEEGLVRTLIEVGA